MRRFYDYMQASNANLKHWVNKKRNLMPEIRLYRFLDLLKHDGTLVIWATHAIIQDPSIGKVPATLDILGTLRLSIC